MIRLVNTTSIWLPQLDNHRIDGTATELEQYIYNRNIHNYHRRNGKLILGYIAYCFR